MKAQNFAFLFILLLLCGPAIAGNGGIQVSPVTVDCGDSNKEAEVLDSASPARIWVNVPAGTDTDGLTFEISDQANPVTNPTTFAVTACGDGWFYGDITLPAGDGTVTLSVVDKDGASVGSDSFRLR
jgi:hypothetical protein